MLPARWARAQTIFIGVAAIAGAAMAFHFGMPLLAFIALLQLLALRSRWRAHAAESVFPRLELPAERKARLQEIFRILEVRAGSSAHDPRARVTQALAVEHRLEAKPMGGFALLATSLVYAALLVVPVAALAYMGILPSASTSVSEVAEAQMRRLAVQRAEWREQAKSATLAELVVAVAAADPDHPLPAPARPEAVAAAEARLHHRMPEDLRAFYAIADGLPGESIAAIADLRALTPKDLVYADGVGRAVNFYPERGEPIEIPAAQTRGWWFLGGPESTLYYLPEPHARLPGVRVFDAWPEDPTAHATLRDYLEVRYAGQKETDFYEAEHQQRLARAKQRLDGASVPELMAAWPEPGFMRSAIGRGWPGPAGESDLAQVERRIGAPLPPDLRLALRTHDGFPPLDLVPAVELDTLARQANRLDEKAQAQFARCVVVAAMHLDSRNPRTTIPRLLWCPGLQASAWVDPGSGQRYASFQQWLFERASERAAIPG